MKRNFTLILFLFTFSLGVVSAKVLTPKTADEIMKSAFSQSKVENKNVFLIFHASWCNWCKRLDKVMNSDELKKIFEDNFVISHLDVLERGEKIAQLENPGGKEYMVQLGGEKSGLPFYAFLNSEGKLIVNSNVMDKESNIGYPGNEEEIVAFANLLKKSSDKFNQEQFGKTVDYLKANAPKPKPANTNMPIVKPDSTKESRLTVIKKDTTLKSSMPVIKK